MRTGGYKSMKIAGKTLFLCFLFLFLSDLFGEVAFSRVMLKNGTALRSGTGMYAVLECQIDNPDKIPHHLLLRLQGTEQSFTEENIQSFQVFIPEKSSVFFKGNVKLSRQENYELIAYCDGKRLGRKNDHSVNIKLALPQEKMIGIWNDSGNSPGGISKHKHLKDRFFSVAFSHKGFPLTARQLTDCSMLLIIRPDYKKYSSGDFSTVLEYAANGGTVIFMDPVGIYEAAKTPLEVMLPVIPLGVRKTASNAFLSLLFPEIKKGLFPDCRQALLLDSVTGDREGVTFAEYEKQPLFREGRFGLGKVRLLAFSPEDDAFAQNWKVGEKSISLLCRTFTGQSNESRIHTVLDMLTGFSVLPLWIVKYILLAYFILLAAALFAGHYYKKPLLGWLGCAIIAVTSTLLLLFASVRLTDKKKNEITTSIETINAFAPEVEKKDKSIYMAKKFFRTEQGGLNEVYAFLDLPKNSYHFYSGNIHRMEPLSVGRSSEGKATVEMTVFPKSSKRYSLSKYGKDLFRIQDHLTLPQIHIQGDSVTLKNWVLPEYEKCEGIFFVFPGGTKTGTLSGNGICRIELDDETFLSDPMLNALRESTYSAKGYASPFLAAVFPIDAKDSRQGKKILLYPLRTVFSGEKILVPSFFIALSAASHTSRMLFDGSVLRRNCEFMPEASPEIKVSLPSSLRNFIIEEIRVKVEYSGKEYISLRPKLKKAGTKDHITAAGGEESSSYIFRGEEIKNILDKDSIDAVLVLSSEFTEAGRTVNLTGTKTATWKIHDLAITVKGRLPDGKKIIQY